MTNAQLLDKLKRLHGFESDNALAEHFGIDRRIVSNYRGREGADNIQRLIILDLLKMVPKGKGAK